MRERVNEYESAMAHRAVIERLWSRPLLDAHLERLPILEQGTVLVAEARCGYMALRWSERLPEQVRVIALDPSRAMLDEARQRLEDNQARRIFLVPQALPSLSYADGVFHASLCAHGGVQLSAASANLGELARVTEVGGEVMLWSPGQGCFAELYELFDEALRVHDLYDAADRLKQTRGDFVSAAGLYGASQLIGLHDVELHESAWRVAFDSGREALNTPLLRQTVFAQWMSVIRSHEREPVVRYVTDAIDTYFHGRVFECSMEAVGLKAVR